VESARALTCRWSTHCSWPNVARTPCVAACCPVGYSPRQTVQSDLCRIVREHLPGFIELTELKRSSNALFTARAQTAGIISSSFRRSLPRPTSRVSGESSRADELERRSV
jgi:hypothetical protein